jgi:uncharacterized protein YlxW (UPF0749 family)
MTKLAVLIAEQLASRSFFLIQLLFLCLFGFSACKGSKSSSQEREAPTSSAPAPVPLNPDLNQLPESVRQRLQEAEQREREFKAQQAQLEEQLKTLRVQ